MDPPEDLAPGEVEIAACGGTAHCDDPEVTALVRAYALGELSS